MCARKGQQGTQLTVKSLLEFLSVQQLVRTTRLADRIVSAAGSAIDGRHEDQTFPKYT